MADVFTKEKRSEVMSRIRGKANKETEMALINIFKEYHVNGWRRNQNLFGKPDFTFRNIRLVIFVDGCFWHCCPLHATWPANNQEFWEKKLNANKARDRQVTRELKKQGWRVMRIWEHELQTRNRPKLIARIKRNVSWTG
jgi:DNA mismatch endonuclease, patch repair protein